uniref:PQ-loop repeat-containing protein n=1 Tax=viral metagenome TaxID=1070528 RepID=A0A6C0B1Y9_9ZZZZ
MYTASILFFLCYLPEFYANYKNKNGNIYNVPEKIVLLLATSFAFSYAVINDNTELITNYGPILFLDIIALSMRVYYSYKNRKTIMQVTNAELESDSKENEKKENDIESP